MIWQQEAHPDGRVTTTTALTCRRCHKENLVTATPEESLVEKILEFFNHDCLCKNCREVKHVAD